MMRIYTRHGVTYKTHAQSNILVMEKDGELVLSIIQEHTQDKTNGDCVVNIPVKKVIQVEN